MKVKYMVGDRSEMTWATSPLQDSTMPLYLGQAPVMPKVGFIFGASFWENGVVKVVEVLQIGDPLNPLNIPLVIVEKVGKQKR